MKILYIGGVYHVEFSLWNEQKHNTRIKTAFYNARYKIRGDTIISAMTEYNNLIRAGCVCTRDDIDVVIAGEKPDLTIFRNFVPTEYFAKNNEIIWYQEYNPKSIDGFQLSREENKNVKNIATQNKIEAKEKNQYWMPYCVSKHWERQSYVKDIPVLVATALPPLNIVGGNKVKSLDILVSPLCRWKPELLHIHLIDYSDGKYPDIIKPLVKPVFPLLTAVDKVSRSKIYISPTSMWFDRGWTSHKLVQAMACGTLVLTNNFPGMEETFGKDGEYLIYSSSQEETLDKVRYYLDNDEARAAISQRAYDYAHTEFNWESRLTGMYEFFK